MTQLRSSSGAPLGSPERVRAWDLKLCSSDRASCPAALKESPLAARLGSDKSRRLAAKRLALETWVFFIVRSVIKNYGAAVVAMGVLVTLTNLGNENVIAETIAAIAVASLILLALLRFGLLALTVSILVQQVLIAFPVALDASRWYFARGFVPVMIVLALAIYGFRKSLGSQPVFGSLAEER